MSRYHSRVGVTSRLRMRGHDYTSPASYLITICTERRLCLFGTITSGEMVLSPAGAVVDSWWHYLPARVGSVELDAAVVMPNHFHAIVHLGTDPDLETAPSLSTVVRVFKRRTTYDSRSASKPRDGRGSRVVCGKRGFTIASFATSPAWNGPGSTSLAIPPSGQTTSISSHDRIWRDHPESNSGSTDMPVA
jgi:REP element-mobilizing transposase RayT